jgi:hypothetical protein
LSKKAILASRARVARETLAHWLVRVGLGLTFLERALTLRTGVTSLLGGETGTPHIWSSDGQPEIIGWRIGVELGVADELSISLTHENH